MAGKPPLVGDSHASLKRVTGTLEDCNNVPWILMHLDLPDTVRVKTVYQLMLEELGQASSLFAGAST